MTRRMTTKELIIKVAGDLFMDKGFQATSTREIALEAGITQPNLYHHFKTKETIYIAVLEDISKKVQKELEIITTQKDKTLIENLQDILNYLRAEHPVNFNIMSHDMTYEISSENHQHLYEIWQKAYLNPVARVFEKHDHEKVPLSANELARHYYAMIAPFIQKEKGFNKEINADRIIYLFVYGILDRD